MQRVVLMSDIQFVEVEEDDLDIPLDELFAPMPAGEVAADEEGEVCCLPTRIIVHHWRPQQFLDPVPEDPGDPWPPGYEEEGRAALADFMKVYEPELADEAASKAIDEAMAGGQWDAEDEDEEEEEDEGPVIPDMAAMTPEQLSHSAHGTVYVTAATPFAMLPVRLAGYLHHQAALVGLGPEDVLRGVLNAALERAGVPAAVDGEAAQETQIAPDGRALHQLPGLGPWNVYHSALLPTPVRTLYMDMLAKSLYVVVCDAYLCGCLCVWMLMCVATAPRRRATMRPSGRRRTRKP